MDLPKKKNRPNLPPKPFGGGAAARQRQFELERGTPDDQALNKEPPGDSDEECSGKDGSGSENSKKK